MTGGSSAVILGSERRWAARLRERNDTPLTLSSPRAPAPATARGEGDTNRALFSKRSSPRCITVGPLAEWAAARGEGSA
jgi:hypothetical protein